MSAGVLTVALLALIAGVDGHGAMTFPRPRNSVDADSEYGGACYSSGAKSAGLKGNGQACFWFNNGCSIGCDTCDGTRNSAGHIDGTIPKFLYKGMTKAQLRSKNMSVPAWTPAAGDMTIDPKFLKAKPGGPIVSNCGKLSRPTICDSRLRTVNTQAECHSPEDIYSQSPWRAPGSAPVIDACGSAGGRLPGMGPGAALAIFKNTSKAFEGQAGSTLPAMPPQATWQAGSNVEVGWWILAQHGGGYSYRLAPASAPLTEKTFQKMPLDFVGPSILRWGGDKATQLEFNASRTSVGTTPAGSMWARNPIPRFPEQWEDEGPAFEPVCEESQACKDLAWNCAGNCGFNGGDCRCSGAPKNVEIVDVLKIPKDLKPGHYVLGWRWDCEETDQIWSSCSDVMVTAAADALA